MNTQDTKIIFFGTPHFGEVILEKLVAARYNVAAVFTQPEKKTGKKRELKASPVKILARKKGIEVFQPENLKGKSAIEAVAGKNPDLIVVAAYGEILPGEILKIPRYGSVNVHASLLPKFRGASPVQEAILSGEKKTGVTIMLMSKKLDAGEIINQEEIPVGDDDDTPALTEKLAELGGKTLLETLPLWIEGAIKAVPQNEKEASRCRSIKKENGKIDWREPAEIIFRKWRAYRPWPGVYARIKDKGALKRLKILEMSVDSGKNTREKPGKIIEYKKSVAVQTGKGLVVPEKVQLEGKKEIDIRDFLRGKRDFSDMAP